MNEPITQSKSWQKLQKDLKETSFYEKNADFSYLAILKSTPVGNYLYLPYGPVAETEKGLKKALESLSKLAKTKSAIFTRIEPQNAKYAPLLAKYGIKSHDLNPKDTWILDLEPDEATLKSNFSQGTRTRYNQFPKKGLSVTTSRDPADIKYLVDLQRPLAESKKISTFDENYLKTELKQDFATLYLVHYTKDSSDSDHIIAASLFFDYEDTRYYMQSAASLDPEYRKLPATVALLATAIFDAKSAGLTKFDFWGIAPDGAPKDHPWAGFTSFKKSFGGTPVHYCGTWDIVYHPLKYKLYQLLRQLNRLKRKIQ